MKHTFKKNSFYLFLIIIFTSCTDVIDVSVPNVGSRLVVQASIDWKKGTKGNEQTIYLRTSKAYFDKNASPVVTGAIVTVTKDNDGMQFVFTDQNDGSYKTTNFIPEIGTSYTLNIKYNGKTYEAKETLTGFSEITKIKQEDSFSKDEYRIRVSFNDAINKENYYMGVFTQENLAVPSLRAIRDEFLNGNEAFILHSDEKNVVNTKIDIKIFGISKQFYYYIEQLIKISGTQGGGPFQATPAQVKGNCRNINNLDEEVLGYFRLSQFEEANYTIK